MFRAVRAVECETGRSFVDDVRNGLVDYETDRTTNSTRRNESGEEVTSPTQTSVIENLVSPSRSPDLREAEGFDNRYLHNDSTANETKQGSTYDSVGLRNTTKNIDRLRHDVRAARKDAINKRLDQRLLNNRKEDETSRSDESRQKRVMFNTLRDRFHHVNGVVDVSAASQDDFLETGHCNGSSVSEATATQTIDRTPNQWVKILCPLLGLPMTVAVLIIVVLLGYQKESDSSVLPTPSPTAEPNSDDRYRLVYDVLLQHGIVHFNSIFHALELPQQQALDWIMGCDISYSVKQEHALVESWMADPVLRSLFEEYSLAVIYFSMDGSNWRENAKWLEASSNCNPCLYNGVTCTEWTVWDDDVGRFESKGVVAELSLAGVGLRGTIPREVSLLRSLELLNLSQNQVSGTIPGSLISLTLLKHFLLGGNAISGTLDSESFFSWPLLKTLHLDNNHLHGSIPSEVGKLEFLESLRLGSNSFSGSIPTSIGLLTSLLELHLHDNTLTGVIPPSIGWSMTNLVSLQLSGNRLSGSISPFLFVKSNLVDVYLKFKFLHGHSP